VDGVLLQLNALMRQLPRASFNTLAQIAVLIIIAILAKMKVAYGVKMENADSQLIQLDVLLNTLVILIAKDTQIVALAIQLLVVDGVKTLLLVLMQIRALVS